MAEREVVPEILQDHATAGELASLRSARCSSPTDPRTLAQREGLALVRERLGEAGATTRVVALAASCWSRATEGSTRRRSAVAGPALRALAVLLALHRGT